MADFPFYESLVPLSADRHKDLRLRKLPNHFDFARSLNSIPLAAAEFADAALEYVIAFVGPDVARATPSVLLGLSNGSNAYVDQGGNWSEGYLPNFVQTYPFILHPSGSEGQYVLCIDEGYAGWNDQEGARMFSADGAVAEGVKTSLVFLKKFQKELLETAKFVEQLRRWDLLSEQVLRVRGPDGRLINLRGVFAVEERRLLSLSDARLLDLFRSGAAVCLYAHIVSMRNLPRLVRKAQSG